MDIRYNGITTAPSDFDSPDGDLSAASGIVPSEGVLRPTFRPVATGMANPDAQRVFIHRNDGYSHYIVICKNGSVVWDGNGSHTLLSVAEGETFTDIAANGNMVLVSTSMHVHYIYWDGSAYVCLGTCLPDIKLGFSLAGHLVSDKANCPNLTFSGYTSAQDSFKPGKSFTFDCDLTPYSSSPAVHSTCSKLLPLFGVTFEQGTEYRFTVQGADLVRIYFGNGNDRREIASTRKGNNQVVFSQRYDSNLYYEVWSLSNSVYVYHAKGAVNILTGFSNNITGKVIEYNKSNFDAVMGAADKFVAENSVKAGRFIYPFFVRYALRLFDGSYSRLSAPVLMIPNSGYVPVMQFSDGSKDINLYAVAAELEYEVLSAVERKWRDIVAGVDIFVSTPVYAYRQGDNFDETKQLFDFRVLNNAGIDRISGQSYSYCSFPGLSETGSYGYARRDIKDMLKGQFGFADLSRQDDWRMVLVAPVSESGQKEKIAAVSAFYRVLQIDFDTLLSTYDNGQEGIGGMSTVCDIKDDTLTALAARPRLEDMAGTNNVYADAHFSVYNKRVAMFGYKTIMPSPSSPELLNNNVYRFSSDIGKIVKVCVYVKTSQGERAVTLDCSDDGVYADSLPWFFYPDNRAYKTELFAKKSDGTCNMITLDMRQHDFLNGAYWLADNLDTDNFNYSQVPSPDIADVPADSVSSQASVLVSEVGNPFVFPPAYAVSVGSGYVLALATAARPLSEGQFGQFPLYAFTDEGVWAVELKSDGTYVARQPVTRDVLVNRLSVASLDSEVVFAADRGIMLLSGSTAVCLSAGIDSRQTFDYTSLPGISAITSGHEVDIMPFRSFIADCRFAYVYTDQRIIVFNPSADYAYVYSIRDKAWGIMQSSLVSTVNSYPDALALASGGSVVSLSSQSIPDSAMSGFFVTRPVKLGQAGTLVSVSRIIQRGSFAPSSVQSVLYGSRDMRRWHVIASSANYMMSGFSGTPYRYFRLAVRFSLSADDYIYGFTVDFRQRYADKTR